MKTIKARQVDELEIDDACKVKRKKVMKDGSVRYIAKRVPELGDSTEIADKLTVAEVAVGKTLRVDWDGPNKVKIIKVSGNDVWIVRVKSDGTVPDEGDVLRITKEELCNKMQDSLSIQDGVNRRARNVIDTLMGAGISRAKANALLVYHGSLGGLRNVKDTKELLKYKYLKELMSERDAEKVIQHLSGKKSPVVAHDSAKFKKGDKVKVTDPESIIYNKPLYVQGGRETAKGWVYMIGPSVESKDWNTVSEDIIIKA